jgi:deoxyribodipyrimidine photo-lyase
MPVAIWWIRRDLRLEDNPALEQACRAGLVVPAFILDDHLLSKKAPRRQNFLFTSLISLDQSLQLLGSRLIIRRGEPFEQLARLTFETGAECISAEEDFSPYARRRDAIVARSLPLRLVQGMTMHHPAHVLKPDGNPYMIFTPFKNKWLSLPISMRSISISKVVWHQVDGLVSVPIPEPFYDLLLPAGESAAKAQLENFFRNKLENYALTRDLMGTEGTSLLSPYIRFGMISPRKAIAKVFELIATPNSSGEKVSAQTWMNELIWREFYLSIIYHFPHVTQKAFRSSLEGIKWNNPGDELNVWQEGFTGFPIVDAGMRQLKETGWMHNRARMITASFLVKDLLINWQLGEKWFMENLLDGDLAANNGGWQWVAGTGTDAAPYFRVFNPVTQSKRFDPQGNYIRRWVPELANIPLEYIHSPWQMSLAEQTKSGCVIGKDYPPPIVNHDQARDRALKAFKNINA